MKKPVKRDLVVSSNDLLEAKYDLTLWQKRVFMYMVSRIGRDDVDFNMQRIYISDLRNFFGEKGGGKEYEVIRRIPGELFEKEMRIPYMSEMGHKRWLRKRILTEITEPDDNEEENNYIEMRFHSDLKPYLLELSSRFSKYDIRNILNLGSVYSFRMFEILKSRHELLKSKKAVYNGATSIELVLEELKEILNVDEKYKLYGDFKRYVLDKASDELAKYCDIKFVVEERKQGKRVSSLVFYVSDNNPDWTTLKLPQYSQVPVPMQVQPPDDLVELLVKGWGVTANIFSELIAAYPEAQIREAVELTKRAKRANKVKDNIAGYFVEALKKGYIDQDLKVEKRKKVQSEQADKIGQLNKEIFALEEERQKKVNDRIRDLIAQSPEIREKAIQSVTQNPFFADYIAKNFKGTPSTEDFRADEQLRNEVINAIYLDQKVSFLQIEAEFLPKIEELKKQMQVASKAG
jgi:plasmid replication initiation protein